MPHIRDALDARGIDVPLIGDFHYIGHKLLTENPACAEALAKYRINPGNVGFREKRDRQFSTMIDVALKYGRPVRIGVNWGSLDQELRGPDDGRERRVGRRRRPPPRSRRRRWWCRPSTARGAPRNSGSAADRIVLSCKVSDVQSLIAVYQRARRALRLTRCISG